MIKYAIVLVSLFGCTTTKDTAKAPSEPLAPPPVITWDLPLEPALNAAIDYGGETLTQVKQLLKRRKEYAAAGDILNKRLPNSLLKFESHQLVNAVHIFMLTPQSFDPELFQMMVQSPRPLANQLGWQLAAVKPSLAIRRSIEATLTKAISENEEEQMLLPQMANAIAANQLLDAYTWAKQGLFKKGNEEFARAMIALDSSRASNDFLPYLARAPAEELRQLTLSTVNFYTCVVILNHMQLHPPVFGYQGFDQLFLYTVSRNTALAELAQKVVEQYGAKDAEGIAQLLARQPSWVQVAFLENSRRRLNPSLSLILSELKKVSAEDDVIREIEEIRL